MLAVASRALERHANVACHLVHGDADPADAGFDPRRPRAYPPDFARGFDFVYCFDVMVHMDAHAMYRCLRRIEALLAEDGRAFTRRRRRSFFFSRAPENRPFFF